MERFYLRLRLGWSWLVQRATPFLRRVVRFLALPWCYVSGVNWRDCTRSRLSVAGDFLYVFFVLKYYPDNYGPCRLWDKPRSEWTRYYGSTYDPWQRYKLRRAVQRKEYEILFEDKEVCLMLCDAARLPTPDLLGVVDPLTDWRGDLRRYLDTGARREIIVKPVTGSAGGGIVLARTGADSVEIVRDDEVVPLDSFDLTERSVVQNIVGQCTEAAVFNDRSLNTVRVLTLATVDGEILILGATMRFGVGEAYRDNWSAGGVAVGIDKERGTLLQWAYDKSGTRYGQHPSSGRVFLDQPVPRWDEIRSVAHDVQAVFPFYRLLGTDVGITDEGPVVIEINAFPDVVFQEQTSGPLLADPRILREFDRWDLLINKHQKRLAREGPQLLP